MQGIHWIDKNGFLSLGGLLFGLTLALLSAGCNHSLNTPREGDYTGTFTATYHVVTPDVNIDTVITGPVTLNLSNDQFENSGNPNRFPPAGSGRYSIQGDSIHFQNRGFYTADFDWSTILNFTYGFEATKKTLHLVREIPNWMTLEYDLLYD